MLRTWPALFALLAACGSKEPDEGPLGPNDSDIPDEDCAARIASITPSQGATEVELDTAVVAVFSEAIQPTARHEVAVYHANTGQRVEGEVTLAGNGLSATFTPASPLASSSTYDVTARVCAHVDHVAFETVAIPVDPGILAGRTFGLDVGDVQWIQPRDADLDTAEGFVLMHVDSVDVEAPSMDVLATTGGLVGGVIVPDCANVSEPPTTDLSDNPEFTVGPVDFLVNTDQGLLTVEGMAVDATFTSDAGALVNLHLLGFVDPAQFDGAMPCAFIAAVIQGTCAPCPTGQGDCIVIEGKAPAASLIPAMDLGSICAP